MHRSTLGFVASACAALLAACATPSTTFQNASGQTVTCSASGWGALGTVAALASHADCVSKAEAAGYRPVDKGSVAPTPSKGGSVDIALPQGWQRKPLLEAHARDGGAVYALDPTIDAGLLVSAATRESIKDLMAYAMSRRADQEGRLVNPASSEITRVDVGGRLGLRFEVSGNVRGGVRVTFLWTIIQGRDHIGVVNTWTSASNFPNLRSELEALSGKLSGLSS